jgi:fibronectin-binding autotransporter adhesin
MTTFHAAKHAARCNPATSLGTSTRTLRLLAAAGLCIAGSAGSALGQTWDGGGADDNVTNALNWSTNVAPVNNGTANLVFTGATGLSPQFPGPFNVNTITFNNLAFPFTLGGPGPLTVRSAIVNSDADTQTIAVPTLILGVTGSPFSVNAASGPLSVATISAVNAASMQIDGAFAITLQGNLAGNYPLVKNGFGLLLLSNATPAAGANADVTINNGTVRHSPTGGDILPNGTNGEIVTINAPGVLDLNSLSEGLGLLAGNGLLIVGSASASISGPLGTVQTFSGAISGTGTLSKIGSGTQILRPAASLPFSGVVSVAGGVLDVTVPALGNATNIDVNAGGTLRFVGPGIDTVQIRTAAGRIETVGLIDELTIIPAVTPLNVTGDLAGSIVFGTSAATVNLIGVKTALSLSADCPVTLQTDNCLQNTSCTFGSSLDIGATQQSFETLAASSVTGTGSLSLPPGNSLLVRASGSISPSITGATGLQVDGVGITCTLLSADHSYTGPTVLLGSSTLALGSTGRLPLATDLGIAGGCSVTGTGAQSVGSITMGGSYLILSGLTINSNTSNSTITGSLQTNSLTKNGGAEVRFLGSPSLRASMQLVLNAGTMRFDVGNGTDGTQRLVMNAGIVRVSPGEVVSLASLTLESGLITTTATPVSPASIVISSSFSSSVNDGVTATIDVPISGAGTFGVGNSPTGTLRMNAAVGCTRLTVGGGIYAITTPEALGPGTFPINFIDGTIRFETPMASDVPFAMSGSSTRFEVPTYAQLSGQLSGTGHAITKAGVGTLELVGPNPASGLISIQAGELLLSSAQRSCSTLSAATGSVLTLANSNLTASVTTISAGAEVTLDATSRINGIVNIFGLCRGQGRINGNLFIFNTGELAVEFGQTMTLSQASGTAVNNGLITIAGGSMTFSQAVTTDTTGSIFMTGGLLRTAGLINNGNLAVTGSAIIRGDVTNSGAAARIVTSGGAVTSFYDDVVHNGGEIRTSAGARTVFLGGATGAAPYTGTGTVQFEGDLRPGNSPAIVTFGGNVEIGTGATTVIELAGAAPGSGYDRMAVTGNIILGGTLNIVTLGGFIPAEGAVFDIITAGSRTGTFNQVNLPTIPGRELRVVYTSSGVQLRVKSSLITLNPGDSITAAADDLTSGGTIVLNPGIYSGPGARGVAVSQPITIRSASGSRSADTLIDLGGLGRFATVTMPAATDLLTLRGITIAGGSADRGAGVLLNIGSLRCIDVAFTGNTATVDGGALTLTSGTADIIAGSFTANTAPAGSAIRITGPASGLSMASTLVAGNTATGSGGAIAAGSDVQSVGLRFVTLAYNTSPGLTLAAGLDAPLASPRRPVIHSSILSGNSRSATTDQPAQLRVGPAGADIADSLIQGWTGTLGGSNNSGADPLFADPAAAPVGNFSLLSGSPAIDTGNLADLPADTFDLDDDADLIELLPLDASMTTRIVGPGIDLGALEVRTVPSLACSPADVAGGGDNGDQPDGTVDGSDFIAFINSFGIGDATVDPAADVAGGGDNGDQPDGTIDGNDFIAFINAFAIGC